MEDVSNSNVDTMETEDEPVYWPDKNKRLQIIETMQKFSLFSKDCSIFHESCCCDNWPRICGEKQANNN